MEPKAGEQVNLLLGLENASFVYVELMEVEMAIKDNFFEVGYNSRVSCGDLVLAVGENSDTHIEKGISDRVVIERLNVATEVYVKGFSEFQLVIFQQELGESKVVSDSEGALVLPNLAKEKNGISDIEISKQEGRIKMKLHSSTKAPSRPARLDLC